MFLVNHGATCYRSSWVLLWGTVQWFCICLNLRQWTERIMEIENCTYHFCPLVHRTLEYLLKWKMLKLKIKHVITWILLIIICISDTKKIMQYLPNIFKKKLFFYNCKISNWRILFNTIILISEIFMCSSFTTISFLIYFLTENWKSQCH